jgi:hypothetical protein
MLIVYVHNDFLKGRIINLSLKIGFSGEILNKEAALTFEILSANQDGVASQTKLIFIISPI